MSFCSGHVFSKTQWSLTAFYVLKMFLLLCVDLVLNRCRYSSIHVHDLYMQPFELIFFHSSSPEVSQRRGQRELKVCPNYFFMVAELRL